MESIHAHVCMYMQGFHIILGESKIPSFPECVSGRAYTVWKLQKFSLTLFSQKFRESNGFTKEITTYAKE